LVVQGMYWLVEDCTDAAFIIN